MTNPLDKITEEKNGNYQSSLKGGGWVPHIGKRPIYFWFFLLKASQFIVGIAMTTALKIKTTPKMVIPQKNTPKM